MAYSDLQMIVVYNGTKASFEDNIQSYKDKLVLVTGNPNNTSSGDNDPYIYAVDANATFKAIQVPAAWVRGLKVNGSSNVYGGVLNITSASEKGISVSYEDGTIKIDSSVLHQLASNASSNATNAGATASAALELAQQNEKDIAALTGDESGGTITDIAKDAVEELRKQVYGEDYTEDDLETIPSLRTDIDLIGENYQVSVKKNNDGSYTISQGKQDLSVKIDVPKDRVVKSGSVVKGSWSGETFTESTSGAGHAIKLVLENSNDVLYINVASLVDVYNGSDGDEITVTISDYNVSATINDKSVDAKHIKDSAITTRTIAAKSVTADKLSDDLQVKVTLAGTSIQEVTTGSEDYIEIGGQSVSTGGKRATVSAKTATIESYIANPDTKGIATVEDVYEFIKARLSVKVV